MTIANELQHYNDGLLGAYAAVSTKGGTVPANKNLDNLPAAIGSISGGGGGGDDPLDPADVYAQTRPADWLKMPEIGANEDDVIYLLLHTSTSTTQAVIFDFGVGISSPSGTVKWEFGTTDSAGVFTPVSALTVTKTGDTTLYSETELPLNAFGSATSDGDLQLMCKISCTGAQITTARVDRNPTKMTLFGKIKEAKLKATNASATGTWGDSNASSVLRFFTWQGTNFARFYATFNYCASLEAVLELDVSKSNSMYRAFFNCSSLRAVPELDAGLATSFDSTFSGCGSLIALPEVKSSSGTNFASTFSNCYSLRKAPKLGTGSGTNFSNMFNNCPALVFVPAYDTGSGTNFSSMFNNCAALGESPTLDTADGTNLSNMFNGCRSLEKVPALDTGSATNLSSMFNGCTSLSTVMDFTDYDFSAATSTSAMSNFCDYSVFGGKQVEFGNKWPTAGLTTTSRILGLQSGSLANATYPVRVVIRKTDAILAIATNATTLFTTNANIFVYVPDALLASYQADSRWNSLGTRLRAFSDLPS